MAKNMNRKEWFKSSGTLLAGFTALSAGILPRSDRALYARKPIKSTRTFISDGEFLARLPVQELRARLSANENPFGPSDKAKEAIRQSIDGSYRYGFEDIRALSEKIADHEGIDQNQILMAAGSSQILLAAAIYLSHEGGNIVTGDPSYADLPSTAEGMGTDVKWIPLKEDFCLDLEGMEAAIDDDTSMVYICNPNNPTATVLDPEELDSFCRRVSEKVPVLIDEAYIEYLDEPDVNSMMSLVIEGYNVIIARTFSKMYGFAGLRVGYMAAREEMVNKIMPLSRGFASISATSASAALAAYNDTEFIDVTKQKNRESKEALISTLDREGYEHIASSTNFVMFQVRLPGERFVQEMLNRGVSVRSWTFAEKNWCRVTVGTLPEMEIFAQAFREIS